MSAVTLLCEIITQGAMARAETFRSRVGFQGLVLQKLVKKSGIIQSVYCDDCHEPHDGEVIFEGEQYGYFCPENGFVSLESSNLLGLKPDLQALTDFVADALECKRRKRTPVHGSTWRIGALDTIAGDLVIYFHPRLVCREDMLDLETALRREVKSPFRLILTAAGSLVVPGTKSAFLDDVLELDPVSGDVVEFSDLRAIVEVPLENSNGRPNVYGAKLEQIIQSRLGNDQALSGRNEEGKAILDAYLRTFPIEKPPSLPTIKRYLTKVRVGS